MKYKRDHWYSEDRLASLTLPIHIKRQIINRNLAFLGAVIGVSWTLWNVYAIEVLRDWSYLLALPFSVTILALSLFYPLSEEIILNHDFVKKITRYLVTQSSWQEPIQNYGDLTVSQVVFKSKKSSADTQLPNRTTGFGTHPMESSWPVESSSKTQYSLVFKHLYNKKRNVTLIDHHSGPVSELIAVKNKILSLLPNLSVASLHDPKAQNISNHLPLFLNWQRFGWAEWPLRGMGILAVFGICCLFLGWLSLTKFFSFSSLKNLDFFSSPNISAWLRFLFFMIIVGIMLLFSFIGIIIILAGFYLNEGIQIVGNTVVVYHRLMRFRKNLFSISLDDIQDIIRVETNESKPKPKIKIVGKNSDFTLSLNLDSPQGAEVLDFLQKTLLKK
ncbi:MAG: hypothetical protein NZ480_04595 [Bdellovibrionaceae bacterium]|nr:hypothetical protein [Pseudobdellovibrionaceae bacterium]MDW8190610.1 hypothetical protein [Pseudobdellovibrionaceae bacterium]